MARGWATMTLSLLVLQLAAGSASQREGQRHEQWEGQGEGAALGAEASRAATATTLPLQSVTSSWAAREAAEAAQDALVVDGEQRRRRPRRRRLLQFPNMGGGGGDVNPGDFSAEPSRKFAFGSFRTKIDSPTAAPTRGFWHNNNDDVGETSPTAPDLQLGGALGGAANSGNFNLHPKQGVRAPTPPIAGYTYPPSPPPTQSTADQLAAIFGGGGGGGVTPAPGTPVDMGTGGNGTGAGDGATPMDSPWGHFIPSSAPGSTKPLPSTSPTPLGFVPTTPGGFVPYTPGANIGDLSFDPNAPAIGGGGLVGMAPLNDFQETTPMVVDAPLVSDSSTPWADSGDGGYAANDGNAATTGVNVAHNAFNSSFHELLPVGEPLEDPAEPILNEFGVTGTAPQTDPQQAQPAMQGASLMATPVEWQAAVQPSVGAEQLGGVALATAPDTQVVPEQSERAERAAVEVRGSGTGVGTRSASQSMSVGELQEQKDMRMLSVASVSMHEQERTEEKGHLTSAAWVGMAVGLACATILSVRSFRSRHSDGGGDGSGGEDRRLLSRPSAVVRGLEVHRATGASTNYGALDDGAASGKGGL